MKGTRSKKSPPPITPWDIKDSTSAPSTQLEHTTDAILQHVLTVVLGLPTNAVLCLTVDQSHGCIEDIMTSTFEDFKDLTLVLPNASTPVKMAQQPRCKGHPCLLQALKLFAAKEKISSASEWLNITRKQFSNFRCTVETPSPSPPVTASSPTPTGHRHTGPASTLFIVETFRRSVKRDSSLFPALTNER